MTVEDELIDLLQDLIRIDSRNPPGNELAVCKALRTFFRKEGISSRIYKVGDGRANLIARIHGNGSLEPILLAAHTDVVPVNEENWSVAPFSGIVKDGFIYGRGALDDKSMLAVNAMTLALLWRQKIPLRRDIIFLATADEEAGGSKGAGWMLARHRDQLEAAFALNEGGRIIVRGNEPLYVAVQTEEKIAYNIKLIAQGTTGHASIPRIDNAIYSLSRALEKLERYPDRQQFDAVTQTFFRGVSAVDSLVEYTNDNIKTNVPLYLSLVTNTISPTEIEGGIKSNVHPPYAEANLNCRLLPWQDVDLFVGSLESWIAPGPYEFKYKSKPLGPDSSPQDGLGFILIEQVCSEMFPGTPVLPYLSPGMTDGTRLRHESIPTYGLLPFPLDEDEVWRLHAADERISIESLMTGMKLVYRVVELGGK
jgi:acetylornithine deacetylase/succinyl-diaminopimelate desuccinylase-like protein